jgi:hypothetical protein
VRVRRTACSEACVLVGLTIVGFGTDAREYSGGQRVRFIARGAHWVTSRRFLAPPIRRAGHMLRGPQLGGPLQQVARLFARRGALFGPAHGFGCSMTRRLIIGPQARLQTKGLRAALQAVRGISFT